MAEIGTAYVSLIPSAKGFSEATAKELGSGGSKGGETAAKGFKGTFTKGVVGLGAGVAGLFAVDKVKDFFGSAIDEARESQKVSAITANVIKTTGSAANVSAKQVGNLATAISNKTGIDDEAVQSASNLLLTFTNVRNEVGKGNDVFNQATQAATDMAASLGKEPKAAAIGLGKALNDPVKGMTALSKVGVSFDAQQAKTIQHLVKTGNTLGAQKVILGELHKEFGGTAAASSTAGEKMGVAWGNFKEQIGTAILPILDKVEKFVSGKIIPAVSKFVTQMQNGRGQGGRFVATLKSLAQRFAPVVKAVLQFVKQMRDGTGAGGKFRAILVRVAGVVGKVAGYLLKHPKLLLAVVAAYGAWRAIMVGVNAVQAINLFRLKLATPATVENTVVTKAAAAASKIWAGAQWLLNAAMDANPITLVVLAVVALVAIFVIAYKKSETFRNIVNGAFHAVKAGAEYAWDFIKKNWPLLTALLLAPFAPFLALAIVVVTEVVKHWSAIVAFFKAIPHKIMSALKSLGSGIGKVFSTAWKTVTHIVSVGAGKTVAFFKSLPKRYANALSALGRLVYGVFKAAFLWWGRIEHQFIDDFVAGIKALPGKLRQLVGLFAAVGKAVIQAFVNGMKNAAGIVSGIAGNVWDTLKRLLDDAISKINSALEFTIHLPLGKSVTINPPDIPQLATGGRARGSYVEVGDGNSWESIIPDRLMTQALTAAAMAGGSLRPTASPGLGGGRVRLVVDDQEFGAYVDRRADERVATQADLDTERSRAWAPRR